MTQPLPRLHVRDLTLDGAACTAWLVPHPEDPTRALFELDTPNAGVFRAETLGEAANAFRAATTEAPMRRGLIVFLTPFLEVEGVVYRTRVTPDGCLVYRARTFVEPVLEPTVPLCRDGYGDDPCLNSLTPFMDVVALPGAPFRSPVEPDTFVLDSEDSRVPVFRKLSKRAKAHRERFAGLSAEDVLARVEEEASYHWRDRPPTPAEVDAHSTDDDAGVWAVRHQIDHPVSTGEWGEAVILRLWTEDGVIHRMSAVTGETTLGLHAGKYRPLSRKTLGPVFWPRPNAPARNAADEP